MAWLGVALEKPCLNFARKARGCALAQRRAWVLK